jgi:hypothetical protein
MWPKEHGGPEVAWVRTQAQVGMVAPNGLRLGLGPPAVEDREMFQASVTVRLGDGTSRRLPHLGVRAAPTRRRTQETPQPVYSGRPRQQETSPEHPRCLCCVGETEPRGV